MLRIKLPIYSCQVFVFFGGKSHAAVRQTRKKLRLPPDPAYDRPEPHRVGLSVEIPGAEFNTYVIWCDGPPTTIEGLAILVHECYHVVSSLLDSIGVDYVPGSSNEAFAYALDYLFQSVLRSFTKRRKKK